MPEIFFYVSVRLMKYLGIDFGARKVGIALSDEGGTLSTPYDTFVNDLSLVGKITALCEKEVVGEIVVGDTRKPSGEENKITERLKLFVEDIIKMTHLPVILEKEYYTSVEAHGREGKESNHSRKTTKTKHVDLDSKAAAIILQRFLDKKNVRR